MAPIAPELLADFYYLARGAGIVVALLISAALAVFVFRKLSPVAKLELTIKSVCQESQLHAIRMEISNISRVRINKNIAMLQILKRRKSVLNSRLRQDADLHISEWVPFTKEAFERMPSATRPDTWMEPIEIMTSTFKIDPGEKKVIEQLHVFEEGYIYQIGIQVRANLRLFERLYVRSRARTDQWTSTLFFVPTKTTKPEKSA